MTQVLEGEVNAFEVLMKKHQDHALRIVKGKVPPEACEEVVHEAFISAFRSLKSFRGDKPFEHWLARITVRTCYDYWRKHYRNKEVPTSALSPGQSARLSVMGQENGAIDGSKAVNNLEDQELLAWALGHLSPKDRMAITLIHLEGRSVAEAADLLGWSPANVKVRIFRARRKLRKIIAREL
ncbi:RNA polymerase sigma factor [Dethiosulfatarculus sandiegensis]|uniref:RNA polymerase sigma factor n=1 Tax=Dethiosulfatarculus sandiegensis TaxID=1429043 RepID=UPI00338F8453